MTMRAVYASDPARSRGRLIAEPDSPTRTPFQRDRDRVIHSGAFRRLMHKTQVFVHHEGDHFRTRLTHSIEVAQIARTIARALALDEDLAEAVALAHDLGHPPFGHAGEEALDGCMAPHGGFNHNEQTLRVLTRLERRYARFDGLNLTWETLEGVIKHNGPLTPESGPVPATVEALQEGWDLELSGWPSAEAQVAALADDIAYNNHDLDDGLRAGLFTLDDLRPLPLVGQLVEEVTGLHPGLARDRAIAEVIRRLIDRMVSDLLAETRLRLEEAAPRDCGDIRAAGRPLVGFSAELRAADGALRLFLHQRMYRHYRVNRMSSKARRVVRALFAQFMAEPNTLPPEWQSELKATAAPDDARMRARVVADYIAGLTDRTAGDEHARVSDLETRA